MKHQTKRLCVAAIAATSLAATGALVGHAAPGEAELAAGGDRPAVNNEPRPATADIGVMLATTDFDPVTLSGDFDGDGKQDSASLSVEYHPGDRTKDATCWVDFALSGTVKNTRHGMPLASVDVDRGVYCPAAEVTDFDGDGAEGITLYMDGDPSGWLYELDSTSFGEMNVDGFRPLKDLTEVGVDRILHFADVSGDGKTDVVAQHFSNPYLLSSFEVMVTPSEGDPTWKPMPGVGSGYFATTADVDPDRPGAEIIFRSAPEVLGTSEDGNNLKLRCSVNMLSATTGDQRAIIAQDADDVCPATDIVAGMHNGKSVLSVGWVGYDDAGMDLWSIGDYSTIHQADANGTFRKVTDYPAPVARRDRVKLTTGSHMGGCIPVLGNDLNTLGARIKLTKKPTHGTAVVDSHGSQCIDYSWTHMGGGTDELEYVVEGPGGTSAPQRLIIESEGDLPPMPVAHDDSYTLEYGRGENVCLPVQENDENAAFSTVVMMSWPEVGNASIRSSQDGSTCIHYNREHQGSEPASFTYALSHMGRMSEPATVSISMSEDAPAPEAHDDILQWSYAEDQPEPLDVLANDLNAGFGHYEVTRHPEHGSAQFDVHGKVLYSPNMPGVESDSFEYEVTTSNGTSQAAVTVTRSGDLPPTPVAADDRVELNADAYARHDEPTVTVDVIANDTVKALSAVDIVSQPTLGSVAVDGVQVTYTMPKGPAAEETRETTFTYTVTNVAGASEAATVTLVLLPKQAPAPKPVAANDRVVLTYGGNEMGCIPVLHNDTNVDGGKGIVPEWTEIAIVSEPSVGYVAGADQCIRYQRAPGAVGNDEFSYKVVTSSGESNVARVRVVMQGTPPTANAALFF